MLLQMNKVIMLRLNIQWIKQFKTFGYCFVVSKVLHVYVELCLAHPQLFRLLKVNKFLRKDMGYRSRDEGSMLVMRVFKHFVFLTCSPFSLFFLHLEFKELMQSSSLCTHNCSYCSKWIRNEENMEFENKCLSFLKKHI